MIDKYMYSITIKRKQRTTDNLGGYTVAYTTIGTVTGMIERADTNERIMAAKLGIDCDYVFMTDISKNSITPQSNDIVIGNGITAILNSSGLTGQAKSTRMKNVLQFYGVTYKEAT